MRLKRRDDGSVQLIQRPASGIWGGLWSPPEFASQQEVELAVTEKGALQPLDELRHAFTHFDLVIRPMRLDLPHDVPNASTPSVVADSTAKAMWYNPAHPAAVGLPAPVTQLIQTLSLP
jgi:A/G-specific adenine glycosylase